MISLQVNAGSHFLRQWLCLNGAWMCVSKRWLVLQTVFEPDSHWSI